MENITLSIIPFAFWLHRGGNINSFFNPRYSRRINLFRTLYILQSKVTPANGGGRWLRISYQMVLSVLVNFPSF
jgi:hypothetical protein